MSELRDISCLRCGWKMRHYGDEEIQLGHHSFLFGDLSNLLSGSLDVEVYVCENCRKVELFYTGDE